MQAIHSIAILGAGALGAVYAARFLAAGGFAPAFVARGSRYERLQRDGVIVNGIPYTIPVVHPDEPAAPADLVIVALKHHHLAEAIHDIRRLVGETTTIISVMNGLDSEERIGAVYGMGKVLYTIAVAIDAVREGNQITYTNPGRLLFGAADNTQISAQVQRVQAALERAGIAYETPPDMIRTMWWKFMINVGVNQASAVLRAPYETFQTSPDAQALSDALMHEVVKLAQAAGVNLAEQDITDWRPILHSLSPDGKTSMLQDIEAGRKTEVEMFAEKVTALGEQYGVATPVNQTFLRLIRVLERYPHA